MTRRQAGQRLKTWRKTEQIRQYRLAELLDITPSYLCNIEAGRKVPSLSLANKLQTLTGIEASSWA